MNQVSTIHLATLHIPRRHLRKKKFGQSQVCFIFLCTFNQRRRSGSTASLLDSYITKQVILPNVSRNLLPNHQHTMYILSVVKTGLQSYCDTSYSMSGLNQMCILKKSKDLLEYIQSRSLSSCNSIKTFDYANLYKTISHSKLMLVQLCFI